MLGSMMGRIGGALLCVFSVLMPTLVYPQDAALQRIEATGWDRLPASNSGIVFIIDADILTFKLADGDKNELDAAKWIPGLPLVKQYRLSPGSYQVFLAEPFGSVTVNAGEGALTYVRLTPYRADSVVAGQPALGVRVTGWSGPATAEVARLLLAASEKGGLDAYRTPSSLSDLADYR